MMIQPTKNSEILTPHEDYVGTRSHEPVNIFNPQEDEEIGNIRFPEHVNIGLVASANEATFNGRLATIRENLATTLPDNQSVVDIYNINQNKLRQRHNFDPNHIPLNNKHVTSPVSKDTITIEDFDYQYKPFNNCDTIKIATMNAQSNFHLDARLSCILLKMVQNNIHILMVTETNRKNKYGENDKYEYFEEVVSFASSKDRFYIIHATDHVTQKNKGCAFIVHSLLYRYIQTIHTLQGRLIYLRLTFKKKGSKFKNGLHLIGAYMPQSDVTDKMKEHKAITSQIESWLSNIPFDHNVIVLGDFNADYSKLKSSLKTNKSPHWKFTLLTFLKNHSFTDIALAQANSLGSKPDPTFFQRRDSKMITSRIDYIFVNKTLLPIIRSFNQEIDSRLSDHAIIIVTCNNVWYDNRTEDIAKPTPIPKITARINYKKITEDQWSQFSNDSERYINDSISSRDLSSINVDQLNNFIESAIHRATNNFPKINTEFDKFAMDRDIENIELVTFKIRKLGKIILKESKKPSINQDFKLSNGFFKSVQRARNYTNCQTSFNRIIERKDLNSFLSNITRLYNDMIKLLDKTKLQKATSNMEKFIDLRNKNFSDNPRKMIDSVLNRHRKVIKLDKVVIVDKDSKEEQLITDRNEIEHATIDHFKYTGCDKDLYGRPIVSKPFTTLPSEWAEIYDPDNISLNITGRDDLMATITLDELISVISKLPSGKASGPSGISYEMIKHISSDSLVPILDMFNKILLDQKIPPSWLKATIYPIPKPKNFEGNLSNTRPITLLECLRKVFVKILNNRLSRYVAHNNLLQPNNRAGINNTSTMEIIHTIQTIVNDQKENCNTKTLYIMLQDLSKAYD